MPDALDRAVTRVGARLVIGAGVTVALGSMAARVQRLRSTAARHAHDLDHAATVGDGPGPALRLLILGDSAARGYGLTDPDAALPRLVGSQVASSMGRPVAVASTATDGHRTADVLAEQVQAVRAVRPDAVVVSVGVNDALGLVGGEALAVATEQLLRAVTDAAEDAAVVLVPCPDLTAAPGFGRVLGALVGLRCRRVAATQLRVARSLGVATVPLPRPDATMFGVDGFHPGASGHAAMAELVADALVARASDVRSSPRPA